MPAQYLEDIRNDHETAYQDIMKESQTRQFNTKQQADNHRVECVSTALRKLTGVETRGKTPEQVDKILADAIVTIESREIPPKESGEETPRNGIYIYKNSELCYFISDTHIFVPTKFAIDTTPQIVVRTNV